MKKVAENYSGKLVIFAGIEGSGRKKCFQTLKDKHSPDGNLCFASEFCDSERASEMYRLIQEGRFTPLEQLNLYLTTRSIFYGDVIVPAIQAGKVVICNKGPEITWAKQVVADNKSDRVLGEVFWKEYSAVMHGIQVSLYVNFCLDPCVALRRLSIERFGDELKHQKYIRDGITDFLNFVEDLRPFGSDSSTAVVSVNAEKKAKDLFTDVERLIMNHIE